MDNEQKRREAIKRLFALRTAEITQTPETARAALIEEGIYDKDGNLTPEYGGSENSGMKMSDDDLKRFDEYDGPFKRFTPSRRHREARR